MGLSKDSLSAREKGDIYWRKLKYYLQSVKEKSSDSGDERTAYMIAAEILKEDTTELSEKIRNGTRKINGHEFKKRPPTATGEYAYKQNILLVMQSAVYFRELLAGAKEKEIDDADRVLVSCLDKLVPVMEHALSTWFTAHGIILKTKAKAKPSDIEAALEHLDEDIKRYEDEVGSFKQTVAKAVIKELQKELPKKTSAKAESPFAEMIAEHEDAYTAHKAVIDKAVAEYTVLGRKTGEYRECLPVLYDLVKEKGAYEYANHMMIYKDAMISYRDFVEEQLAAAEWAKKGCVALVRALLLNEIADPMLANYIHSHWNEDVDTYPLYTKVKDLPGFTSLSDQPEIDTEVYEFPGEAEVKRAIAELREYKNTHPELFEYQTITDLLFATDDLPQIAGKAKQLRTRIAVASKTGELSGYSKRDKIDIGEAWILADSIARVGYVIIEYKIRSEKKTLADLVASFPEDFYEMGYYAQERLCRATLEAYGIRRRLDD